MKRSLSSASFPILGTVVMFAGCHAAPSALEEDDSEIRGGRVDHGHTAVGMIGHAPRARASPSEVDWICTGTLIEPARVLTAAHCLFDAESGRRVSTGRIRFEAGDEVFGAVQTSIAPDYDPDAPLEQDDLALLGLEAEVDLEPIPAATSPPLEGEAADVIGFGVTRAPDRGAGRRRRARIHLDEVWDRELAYDAYERGACYGDSGGPILQNLGDGEVVVGVTSRGSAPDCDGINVATRVDTFAAWLED